MTDPIDPTALPDDVSDDTIARLCEVLRDLANAIENRYAARLIAHRRRVYERDACAQGRADQLDQHPDEPPF